MTNNPPRPIEAPLGAADVVELYIAVTDRFDDVLTITGPHDEVFPIVAIDEKSLGALRTYSQDLANKSGQSVRIIRFTRSSLHETFRPLATGDNKQ